MDFGVWYNEITEGNDTISYGAFATSQDMFNQMLNELDIFWKIIVQILKHVLG